MSKLLEGKVAIVTGSGQGIGFEIAKALANEGCKIITNNRKPGSSLISFENSSLELTEEERQKLENCSGDAQTAASYINSQGGTATPFFGNVNTPEVAQACIQTAIDNYGRIDILINNAHTAWTGSLTKMTPKEWHLIIDAKLNGAFYMIHAALPYMLEQKYGRIMNASSDGWLGLKGKCAYGAACAGIWSFTRSIAQDLEGTGITANAYTPLAKTRSWYSMLATYRTQGVPAAVIENAAPESMQYTADQFAPFFAYLASDKAADITGHMFKTGADGQIGIWSNPMVEADIWTDKTKPWTMEELIVEVPKLLPANQHKTTIDLK